MNRDKRRTHGAMQRTPTSARRNDHLGDVQVRGVGRGQRASHSQDKAKPGTLVHLFANDEIGKPKLKPCSYSWLIPNSGSSIARLNDRVRPGRIATLTGFEPVLPP